MIDELILKENLIVLFMSSVRDMLTNLFLTENFHIVYIIGELNKIVFKRNFRTVK